jgi:methylated-DNA-[protein]-cysteine S-methyltransferase
MAETDRIERALRTTADAERPLPDMSDAAAAAGLLDVAYATLDSPLGRLLLAVTPRGLARVAYVNGSEDAIVEDLAIRLSPRVLRSPRKLDEPRRELDEYFEKRRTSFDLPLDWSLARGFGRRVLRATAQIPYGSVSTYARVAARAGSPRAYRAAGTALGHNPMPIVVPCHRVLHADGGLGGYTGGVERKRLLLGIEGAER